MTNDSVMQFFSLFFPLMVECRRLSRITLRLGDDFAETRQENEKKVNNLQFTPSLIAIDLFACCEKLKSNWWCEWDKFSMFNFNPTRHTSSWAVVTRGVVRSQVKSRHFSPYHLILQLTAACAHEISNPPMPRLNLPFHDNRESLLLIKKSHSFFFFRILTTNAHEKSRKNLIMNFSSHIQLPWWDFPPPQWMRKNWQFNPRSRANFFFFQLLCWTRWGAEIEVPLWLQASTLPCGTPQIWIDYYESQAILLL